MHLVRDGSAVPRHLANCHSHKANPISFSRQGGWHLELVDGPVDDDLADRLERAGGTRVSAGPYWDRWGVTFADPDGYRLVLGTRA
nr:VOC family protein [Micromonospora sp. RTP1Z1]